MARPIVGDVRIKQERRHLNNGRVYVYERVVKYDPETRRNITLQRKLLGIEDPETGKIIPTKPKRVISTKTGNSEDNDTIQRKKIGVTSLLEWVGKASGIDEDLKVAFGDDNDTANKCINIARYWVATNGETLPNMRTWQIKHAIAEDELITENLYKQVFDTLGQNESYVQNYFKCRCNGLEKRSVIAIDSTTTSTYSQQLDAARYGFNKQDDSLPTIKTLTLYSLDAHQPLAFYHQPGNIPDIISIKNALRELSYLNISKPLIVSDNGFYSLDNITAFIFERMRFLTRVTLRDGAWLKKIVDEHLNELDLFSNQLDSDANIQGVSICFEHNFERLCKYNTEGHKAGDKITVIKKLHLHIYRLRENKHQEEKLFASQLADIKAHLLAEDELTPAAQKIADECFIVTKSRGKISVTPNQDGCLKRSRYFGLLLLLTNDEKDKESALAIYRKREHIEDHYEKLKNIADGNKPRVCDDWRFKGRQFVQFVSLGYFDFLYKKIKTLKQTLGQVTGDPVHDLSDNLKLEKKVKSWLENKSLHEIFEWFDCVESVNLHGGKHPHVRLITEQIKRDKKFLEVIGYSGILTKN